MTLPAFAGSLTTYTDSTARAGTSNLGAGRGGSKEIKGSRPHCCDVHFRMFQRKRTNKLGLGVHMSISVSGHTSGAKSSPFFAASIHWVGNYRRQTRFPWNVRNVTTCWAELKWAPTNLGKLMWRERELTAKCTPTSISTPQTQCWPMTLSCQLIPSTDGQPNTSTTFQVS